MPSIRTPGPAILLGAALVAVATPIECANLAMLTRDGKALRFTLDLSSLTPRGPYGGGINLDFSIQDPFETPRDTIGFVYSTAGFALFEAEFGQHREWHNPSSAIFILDDRLPNAAVSVDIFAKSGAFMIDVDTVSFLLVDPDGEPMFDIPVTFEGPIERPDGRVIIESHAVPPDQAG